MINAPQLGVRGMSTFDSGLYRLAGSSSEMEARAFSTGSLQWKAASWKLPGGNLPDHSGT